MTVPMISARFAARCHDGGGGTRIGRSPRFVAFSFGLALLGAVALRGRRGELLGRLLELVPLGVDPDGLVLVTALLLHPAPLLPRRHGGLA